MLDTKGLDKYLNECKNLLGEDWLKLADKATVGYDSVGSIAKRWCIHCYISFHNEQECVERLKQQFPEIK